MAEAIPGLVSDAKKSKHPNINSTLSDDGNFDFILYLPPYYNFMSCPWIPFIFIA